MIEYRVSKEDLVKYLSNGLSAKDIENITGIEKTKILYDIKKYELNSLNKYYKPKYVEDFFHKIDSKEKAYMLGFLLGDGSISKENKLSCTVTIEDREILDKFSNWTGAKIREDFRKIPSKKVFPHVEMKIGNSKLMKDINMLFGGKLKEERHIPIISKKYEHYLVQGFFDAEGCITFGRRKDRNRIWCKISFTSQLKMLEGIQNILYKNGIVTKIHPKGQEKCFVLEFSKPETILKFLNYLYSDNNFIILQRKYDKAIALRLELGENGEGHKSE